MRTRRFAETSGIRAVQSASIEIVPCVPVTVLNMLNVIVGHPSVVTTSASENEPFERNFLKNHAVLLSVCPII